MHYILLTLLATLSLSKAWSGSHGIDRVCVQSISPLENVNTRDLHHHHSLDSQHISEDEFRSHWSGAEHMQLGDLGFAKACNRMNLANESFCARPSIRRNDQRMSWSYGRALALGDFYLDVDRAFFEKGRQGDIGKLFACMDKEGRVHHQQRHFPETTYPSCTWVHVLHGGDYLRVVSNNFSHFVWDNIKAYTQYHQRALHYARAAGQVRRRGNIAEAHKLLNRALFINAFADHFLTDAFAAGHLRVPRRELKQWAEATFASPLAGFVGDALAMLLHDFEAKDETGRELGLWVQNARGQYWRTASDNHMNVCASEDSPQIAIPLQAVEISVSEIFAAYLFEKIPRDNFAALEYVPYSDPQGFLKRWSQLNLSDNRAEQIASMRRQLPLPLQWILPAESIEAMLDDLPRIVESFHRRVSHEYRHSPQLQRRLPKAFVTDLLGSLAEP